MTYTPQPPRKQAGFVSAAFFIICIAAYALSLLIPGNALPFRLIMMISACAAIYIMVRYLYTGFTYTVRPQRDGESIDLLPPSEIDFCVTRSQGNRRNLECVLALDKLRRICDFGDGTANLIKGEFKGIRFYYYTASIKPTPGLRQALIFDDEGELSCIVIEPDDKMKDYLTRVVRDAADTNL